MNKSRQSTDGDRQTWIARISQLLIGEPQTRHQLLDLLRSSEQRHLIDPDALAMVEGALQVSEMQVREIMVPRAQMVFITEDAELDDIVALVIGSGHSRFPVMDSARDTVQGILLAKDLLPWMATEKSAGFRLRDMMFSPVFIPESKRLNVLLQDFRRNGNHMAIVVDEHASVCGLVTIEDVIEQIVGDIDDEHDLDEDAWTRDHPDGHVAIKALMPIEKFNKKFGTHYKDDEFDTVGGLVLKELGHLPVRGEELTLGNLQIKVLRADGRRIHLLHVLNKDGKQQSDAESGTGSGSESTDTGA